MIRKAVALAVCVFLSASCSSSPEDPGGHDDGGVSSMTATLDGSPWQATPNTVSASTVQGLLITGSDAAGVAVSIAVNVAACSGGQVFTVGGNGGLSFSVRETSGALWVSSSTGGSGTLSVESCGGGAVSGRFSFDAPAANGTPATGSRVLTDGRFSIRP